MRTAMSKRIFKGTFSMENSTNTGPVRTLRISEVSKRAGVCRATIYNWTKSSGFPRQVKIGPKLVGWIEHEVEAWFSERIAERDSH